MAKSKRETVNKSQAIRDALDAHPDKSPSEIAEELKAKGLDVNAQYVSTIKSNAKAKSRRTKLVRRGRAGSRNGLGPVGAALEFIREAGGLEAAKHALQTVEEIRLTVR
jgi:soluble cytochrome b562